MKLTVRWANKPQVLSYIRGFSGPRVTKTLQGAVGKAAIRVQGVMRQNLESMVYAQPQAASGYVRTRTLHRSTHAARPSNDHSGDEARASGGTDLAASDPMQVVEKRGDTIASEIGSWISYAEQVHEGVNQPSSRPFVANAVQQANDILAGEVAQAVQTAARRR